MEPDVACDDYVLLNLRKYFYANSCTPILSNGDVCFNFAFGVYPMIFKINLR